MGHLRFAVIRGGVLLDPATEGTRDADILVGGGTIREIGAPGLAAPDDAFVIDAAERLLIPGLVNAHTHGHGGLAKGLVPDRVPLEAFLALGGALFGGRGTEDKYLSTLVSAVEMVRKGCTASFDLALEFPAPSAEGVRAVAQAYHDVGMRAVVAPMMADRTLYQALPGLLEAMPEALRAQAQRLAAASEETHIGACRAILSAWAFDRERIRPALAPTIPIHCSDDFLIACERLSRDFAVAMQTHLAESKTQALLSRRRYGESLVAHLARLGLLSERLSAAHAIWIDADEIGRLADAGVKVAHNPLSNLRLGSGAAPVRAMLERGMTLGIGTDGVNTSDAQNMLEATRLAAYLSRLGDPDHRRWLSAAEALRLATQGSAAVLGWADRLGRLAPGYGADIVFLDLRHINYVPLNHALRQLVFGENGGAVDSVMIDGRLILDRGRLTTIDEAKLRHDAQCAAERLRDASARDLQTARALSDLVGLFCLGHARTPHPVHRALPWA